MEPIELKWGDFTPGARNARGGSVACRPHHDDWPEHNLKELQETIARNPYIRHQFGDSRVVTVVLSADGKRITFEVTEGYGVTHDKPS